PGLGTTHGVDHHVGTVGAVGPHDLLDGGDRVGLLGVDRVGGTHGERLLQLPGVDVDGDDLCGTSERSSGDRGHADATATDHRDALATGHVAGVDGGAETGHHATPEQADSGGTRCGVDLGALSGGDQGLL